MQNITRLNICNHDNEVIYKTNNLSSSVKSRGKLFEGVRGSTGGECQEMPEDTCHDVGGPLQDESG